MVRIVAQAGCGARGGSRQSQAAHEIDDAEFLYRNA